MSLDNYKKFWTLIKFISDFLNIDRYLHILEDEEE